MPHGLRLTVRLVKGAYWDTEIKRAQERGLDDYPVFTRKAMTDLCYMACVRRLLAARSNIFPQFATHNALTVATVIEDAGGIDGFEFQRLHGMGEALYEALIAELPNVACRIYAPVGGYRDLLAYLVRRLLENGANSSFVSVAADTSVPIEQILRRPQDRIGNPEAARNRNIPLPRDLYAPIRRNSAGIEFGEHAGLDALVAEVRRRRSPAARGRRRNRRHRVRRYRARSVVSYRRPAGWRRTRCRRGDGGSCHGGGRSRLAKLGRDLSRRAR